jgi:hypothetical protein
MYARLMSVCNKLPDCSFGVNRRNGLACMSMLERFIVWWTLLDEIDRESGLPSILQVKGGLDSKATAAQIT